MYEESTKQALDRLRRRAPLPGTGPDRCGPRSEGFANCTVELLSTERVVVEPPASETDWSEPGDVVEYHIYETTGWTDEWPDVVEHPSWEE